MRSDMEKVVDCLVEGLTEKDLLILMDWDI